MSSAAKFNIDDFDIADKIIEVLCDNRDKFYSLRELHSILFDKFEEFRNPELKSFLINKLKVAFISIEGDYNNVYRIVIDNKHYLIWSLKSKDSIIKESNKDSVKNIEDAKIDEDLDNFLNVNNSSETYITIIRDMIREKNYSFMYESNFIDGTNHPIHLLIANNENKLIKDLDELTTIDFNIKNSNGKNCLDVAKEAKNFDVFQIILDKNYQSKLKSLEKINDTLKDNQKKIYEQMDDNKKKIAMLEKKIQHLKSNATIETIKTIFIFVLFIYFCNTYRIN